jgi:LmbE family N-acetylglucosaminyl deacetylase
VAAIPTVPLRLTPEPAYTEQWARRLDGASPLLPSDAVDVRTGDSLLVVVAHPDDETLAVGGTLADLSASGVRVHVLSLTSGEAALDHVGEPSPGLGARRRAELEHAGRSLGLAGCTSLDLPDGRLAEHPGLVEVAVRTAVDDLGPARVVTLWRDDPHPDHRAAGRAVQAVCAPGTVDEFLLWTMHWTDPADVAVDVAPVAYGRAAGQARRTALRGYRSQVEPLADHLEPVLPAGVVLWPHECVVRP